MLRRAVLASCGRYWYNSMGTPSGPGALCLFNVQHNSRLLWCEEQSSLAQSPLWACIFNGQSMWVRVYYSAPVSLTYSEAFCAT
eukprot:12911852-Prorocentrum_lima.AAC.1